MHKRPVIGIPTQSLHSMHGVPASLPASYAMSERYIRTVAQAGGVPYMIPLVADDEETARALYDGLDGILLPGGADLDPRSYGEAPRPKCDRCDPARDLLELALVRWAWEERKPVLGVCRGLQIVNVARGGTLYQDVTDEMAGAAKHDYFPGQGHERDFLAHDVRLVEGSRLATLCGGPSLCGARDMKVNSLHHQGIAQLGDGLVVSATAGDGLIEGVERPADDDHFLVAVQWHPEALYSSDASARRFFGAFVEAACAFRESHRDEGVIA